MTEICSFLLEFGIFDQNIKEINSICQLGILLSLIRINSKKPRINLKMSKIVLNFENGMI